MSRYRNDTFRKFCAGEGLETELYNTNLVFFKYSAFGQVSRASLDEKLRLSFGIRAGRPLPIADPIVVTVRKK